MAFQEQVTFFSDETKTRPVFALPGPPGAWTSAPATTSPTTPGSRSASSARTSARACCARRSTSRGPGYAGTGQERSQLVALLRRFTEVPFLPVHFDFAAPHGAPLLSVGAPGHRPRPLHGARPRRPGRLPRGGGAGRRPRRPDAAVRPMAALPGGPPRRRGRGGRRAIRSHGYDIAAARAQARAAAPRRVARGRRGGPRPRRRRRPGPALPARRVPRDGLGRAPARRRVRLPRRRRARPARPAGWPTGRGMARAQRRLPPRRPSTGSRRRPTTSTRCSAWLDREGGSSACAGPTFVHGDSAGGNLALVAALRHPGRVPRGGAGLPVPRPDRRLRVLPHGAADGFDPREAAWYWQQYAADAGRPRRTPTSRRCCSDRLGDPAADAGRDRRARPAARRGRAARRACSPRPASRSSATRYLGQVHGFWRHPAVFPAAEPLMRQVGGVPPPAVAAGHGPSRRLCENPPHARAPRLRPCRPRPQGPPARPGWPTTATRPVDHGPFVYDAVDDYPVFCLRAAEGVAAEREPRASTASAS